MAELYNIGDEEEDICAFTAVNSNKRFVPLPQKNSSRKF